MMKHMVAVRDSLGLVRRMNTELQNYQNLKELYKKINLYFFLSSTLPVPKIFAAGSQLVFRPAKDVTGVIKVLVFPVDLPPGTKDLV